MNPTKDQKEESFFDSFLTLARNIPDGNWLRGESPDYLLTTNNSRIGLEITILTTLKAGNQYEMTAIRTAQDKAITLAKELAVKSNLPPVEVEVKFQNDRAGIDVDLASQELYTCVKKYLKEIDNSKLWHKNTNNSKIFSGFNIRMGTLNGKQWLSDHRWGRLNINFIHVDPIGKLQNCIDKKHRKLSLYLEKCDKCWLLIGVDEWTAPEAFDISINGIKHLFHSNFERVYFLRNTERKLYRLRIK